MEAVSQVKEMASFFYALADFHQQNKKRLPHNWSSLNSLS